MPNIEGINLLDIGCGGGLFLSKLKSAGARVQGIELSDSRAHYARTRHNIDVVKRPVEDVNWQDFKSSFDIVTLWDVIEHVNFPRSTLKASAELIKTGGLMFIDTPCRDSFYHRIVVFTYKISLGVFPTFLNSMYSAHAFGHKQIFSVKEIEKLLQVNNFEIVEIKKFHELSFPCEFYLKNILRHDLLVKASLPLVKLLLTIFPVKNKMLAVGRKK